MNYIDKFNEETKNKRPRYINKEAKNYILSYLDSWLQELGQYPFSYRKGIVRAIYSKIESIPSN